MHMHIGIYLCIYKTFYEIIRKEELTDVTYIFLVINLLFFQPNSEGVRVYYDSKICVLVTLMYEVYKTDHNKII